MRRRHRESAMGADVGFEPPVDRKTAPIGVVRRPAAAAFRGTGRAGRLPPRGNSGHPLRPRPWPVSLTGSPPFERPLIPTTRPSSIRTSSTVKPSRTSAPASSRGVDEQFVEHGPPGAVRDRRVFRARRPGDGEGTEIERVGVNRRTSGRRQPIEQSPSCEGGGAQWVHHMRGHRVARERRTVDDQHAVSLVGPAASPSANPRSALPR